MKRVNLQVRNGWWMYTFEDEADVAKMMRIFGTARVATNFDSSADPEVVRRAVAARKPGYEVRVWGQPD